MTVDDKIEILESIRNDLPTVEYTRFSRWLDAAIHNLQELYGSGALANDLINLKSLYRQELTKSHAAPSRLELKQKVGKHVIGIVERLLSGLYSEQDKYYSQNKVYPTKLLQVYRNLPAYQHTLNEKDIRLTEWLTAVQQLAEQASSVQGVNASNFKELRVQLVEAMKSTDRFNVKRGKDAVVRGASQELSRILLLLKQEIKEQMELCRKGQVGDLREEYEKQRTTVTKDISSIPSIDEKLKQYKALRSHAKSAYNKYKSEASKYSFLNVIVLPKILNAREEDDNLEVAVRDLFNSIEIKSIVPSNKDNFDVIAKFKDVKLGIEVKNGNLPGENEMLQVSKYKARAVEAIQGLLIWNDAKGQGFDSNRIKDAELHNFGIMTTQELRNGYLKLKKGKITFEQFLSHLQKIGLIKFSSRALR
jgi:hypothetical protein